MESPVLSGIHVCTPYLSRLCSLSLALFLSAFSFQAIAVDLIRVDKSERRMYLIENGNLVREYVVALGKNPRGHKQQRGDKRTPEGAYYLDFIKQNSSFYRAMHISYPNEQDRQSARQRGVSPGGSIMIHGQPNRADWNVERAQKLNWTNGCIALTNEEMDEFMALVDVGTPIRIDW